MGVFSGLKFGKINKSGDNEFVKIVRAMDNNEEWAQKKMQEIWSNSTNEEELISRIDNARIEIYKNAAYQGDTKAQYWLGTTLGGINNEESLRLLKNLAEKGDIAAMKSIALGYTEYGGYGQDDDQYLYWNLMAAKKGDAEAQSTVGLEYMCRKNINEAYKWYSKAAEQDNSRGYLGIGECYERMNNCNDPHVIEMQEQAFLDAYRTAKTADDLQNASWKLGCLYASEYKGVYIPERAAYFFYLAYHNGNQNSYIKFVEIVNQNHLDIDIENVDMNYMEEWADKRQI